MTLEDINIVKITITTESNLQVQCNPIKIPMSFFKEIEKS
jgi:hypothetical protein